jgi:hypothetical protein
MSIILTIYITLFDFIKKLMSIILTIYVTLLKLMSINITIYVKLVHFIKNNVNHPNYICSIRPFYQN